MKALKAFKVTFRRILHFDHKNGFIVLSVIIILSSKAAPYESTFLPSEKPFI